MTGLGPKEKAAAIGAGFEGILLCALVLTNQPAGDPLIGLIAAGGERRMLSGISPALGILANQVTPTLERIVLSEEVVRQRGEALFRTLVQDALDVILVLGDDGIVKYASPSATRLFGDIRIDGAKADSLTADFEQVMTRPVSGPVTGTDARAGPYQITRRDGRRLFVEARFTDRAGHAITGAAKADGRRHPVHRSGRLQGRQRHDGACGGGRAPGRSGGTACRGGTRVRHRRPARRG